MSISDDTVEITIGPQDAIDRALEVEPRKDDLGTSPDVEDKGVSIRIGTRPRVLDLRQMYTLSGRKLPAEYEATFDGFRIWLVCYYMSVKNEGRRRLEVLHLEVTLPEKPRVTVSDLFPKSSFETRAKIGGELQLDIATGVDLSGGFGLPPELTELLSQTDYLSGSGKASTSLKLGGKAGIVGRLGMELRTPIVESMGRGDTWSRWAFHRHSDPLLNDFAMFQTLIVPKVVEKLRPQAACGVTTTTFGFLPSKQLSKPVELECHLPRTATS